MLAASLPERVERLTLIDGLGRLIHRLKRLRANCVKGLVAHRRPLSRAPRYPDIESAIAARVAGGVTPVDSITATPLVERNTQPTADGHVQMRTDSRLLKPSLVRFTPEQVLALLGKSTPGAVNRRGTGDLGERAWRCRRGKR